MVGAAVVGALFDAELLCWAVRDVRKFFVVGLFNNTFDTQVARGQGVQTVVPETLVGYF